MHDLINLNPMCDDQYCSSDEDYDSRASPSSSHESPSPPDMVPHTNSSNGSSTETSSPRKRKCYDSDSRQLERFVDEIQEMSLETLVSKISGFVPIISEIESGKVSYS